jgi:hypothetical protein
MDPNFGLESAPDATVSSTDVMEEPPPLTGKMGNFLSRVGRTLGATGEGTATFFDQIGNKNASFGDALQSGLNAAQKNIANLGSSTDEVMDFDKVLENADLTIGGHRLNEYPTARAVAGFAGDVVVDPLNLVGGLPVKMLSKAGVKLPSLVAKAAGGSSELSGAVGRMLKTAGTKLEEAPIVGDVLEKFVQFSKLGNEMSKIDPSLSYRDMRRLAASRDRHAGEISADWAEQLTKGIDRAGRREIALALDEGRQLSDPKLQKAAQRIRQILDNQVAEDVAAGSLQASKVVPNYVPRYPTKFDDSNPKLRTVLAGKTKMDSLRKEKGLLTPKTLAEAEKRQGALTDIAEITGRRLAEGMRANRSIEFMKQTVEHFGEKGVAKPGYRTLSFKHLKDSFHPDAIKGLDNVYFPEKIAQDLEKVALFSSKETEFSKLANSVSKMWRGYALSSPGHQFTNFVGNVANMHLGGMSMKEIAEKYSRARGLAKILNNEPMTALALPYGRDKVRGTYGIGKYTNYDIDKAIKEYEIVGTATQLGELKAARNAQVLFRGQYNPLNADNVVLETTRKWGQKNVEEPARIAFFLHRLEKGDSLEKAALKTKEILFDYGELTETEKKLKLGLVPFYCVPDDGQILTKTGWKYYWELTTGADEVLVYDHEKDHSYWETLNKYATFDYEGELLTLEDSRNGKFSFTPNHGWPVVDHNGNRSLVKGYELRTNHKIPLVSASTEWPEESTLSPLEAEVLGWVLTDGYVDATKRRVNIYQSKPHFVQHLLKLLENDASYYVSARNEQQWDMYTWTLRGALKDKILSLIPNKHKDAFNILPHLNKETAQILWTAMYNGDGTTTKRLDGQKQCEFFAQHEGIIFDFFQILTLMLGRVAQRNKRGAYIRQTRYFKVAGKQGVEWYKGKIWCPELNGKCWYLRRNGKVILSQNTWTRKNVPLQLKAIAESPERLEKHKDFLEMFQNMGDGQDFAQPEYLTESGYVPLPLKGEKGTPTMGRMALPAHDLGLIPNALNWDALENTGRRLAGMAAPWAKIIPELTLNQELQSGVPIFRSSGLSNPSPLGNLMNAIGAGSWLGVRDTPDGPKQHDVMSYLTRMAPGFSWMANTIPGVREDDPITGDRLNVMAQILGGLAGLNPRLINLQQQASEQDYRMEEYDKRIRRSLEP